MRDDDRSDGWHERVRDRGGRKSEGDLIDVSEAHAQACMPCRGTRVAAAIRRGEHRIAGTATHSDERELKCISTARYTETVANTHEIRELTFEGCVFRAEHVAAARKETLEPVQEL